MDKSDVIKALECSSKGQLFNKPAFVNNSEEWKSLSSNGFEHKKITYKERSPWKCSPERDKVVYEEEVSDDESLEDELSQKSEINNSLENYNFTDVLLSASNELLKAKVTNFVARKQKEFESKEKELHVETLLKENLLIEKARQKTLQIEAEEKEHENIYAQHLETKQQQLRESHHRHAKLLDKKNMEAKSEIQQRENMKIQEKRMIEKLHRDMEDITKGHSLLLKLISQRESFNKMPPALATGEQIMKQIVDKCTSLFERQELSEDDLNAVSSMSLEAKKIVSIVQKQISEINVETNAENQPKIQCKESPPTTTPSNSHQSKSSPLHESCSKEFYRLLRVLSETETSLKDLNDNPMYKDFKKKLTRIIFEPLSTLNDHRPDLTKHFHNKLCRLFQGEVVDLPGGEEKVSIQGHPSSILFCLDKLALKIVAYGEKAKSGEQKSLCKLAASILHEHPNFGDLLLGQLAVKCPFVVPHVEEKDGKTDIEHYRFLGFNLIGGKLEKEDLYLKRMSNIISFYGGVLVAEPIQLERLFGAPVSDNSYRCNGMKHAWTWLASFLHQNVLEGISAAALCSFLVATGSDLAKCYGRQYIKVIVFIKNVYLKRLSEAGQKENATVFNLTEYIQKFNVLKV